MANFLQNVVSFVGSTSSSGFSSFVVVAIFVPFEDCADILADLIDVILLVGCAPDCDVYLLSLTTGG